MKQKLIKFINEHETETLVAFGLVTFSVSMYAFTKMMYSFAPDSADIMSSDDNVKAVVVYLKNGSAVVLKQPAEG